MNQGAGKIGIVASAAAFVMAATLAVLPAAAQQVTGALGSPRTPGTPIPRRGTGRGS